MLANDMNETVTAAAGKAVRETTLLIRAGTAEGLVQCPDDPTIAVQLPRPLQQGAGEELMTPAAAAIWIRGMDNQSLLDYLQWLDSHCLGRVLQADRALHSTSAHLQRYDGSGSVVLSFYLRRVDEARRVLMWCVEGSKIVDVIVADAAGTVRSQLLDFFEEVCARTGTQAAA